MVASDLTGQSHPQHIYTGKKLTLAGDDSDVGMDIYFKSLLNRIELLCLGFLFKKYSKFETNNANNVFMKLLKIKLSIFKIGKTLLSKFCEYRL